MTTSKRNTKRAAVEAVAGDRDLMKEALQEVLEGEMTEFLGALGVTNCVIPPRIPPVMPGFKR